MSGSTSNILHIIANSTYSMTDLIKSPSSIDNIKDCVGQGCRTKARASVHSKAVYNKPLHIHVDRKKEGLNARFF